MKYIKTALKDHIGTVCFDNDEKRNSLNKEMLEEYIAALNEFSSNDARVVVVRANPGVKVWCAGLNISELPKPGKDPLSYKHPFEKVMRKIQSIPVPVIAMIEGSVWGGGCDMAFTCDILIGTNNTSFAITPAKIGVPYNTPGMVHFLNMVELNIAKEMFFTASPIDAEQAKNLGILNHLVPLDELEEFTYRMAKKITLNSPLSIAVIKEQLNVISSAKPINSEVFEKIEDLRNRAYESDDYREGVQAFIEKRHPRFRGK